MAGGAEGVGLNSADRWHRGPPVGPSPQAWPPAPPRGSRGRWRRSALISFDSFMGLSRKNQGFQTSAFRFGPVLRPPCNRHLPEGKSPAFLHCPPLRVLAPQGRNSRSTGRVGNFGGGKKPSGPARHFL